MGLVKTTTDSRESITVAGREEMVAIVCRGSNSQRARPGANWRQTIPAVEELLVLA